ncbi:MAG: hypothetical protein JST11_06890 [Acidobacteria bacterium]|nr:hypothetical protein [Acidobacteriota bacterium]
MLAVAAAGLVALPAVFWGIPALRRLPATLWYTSIYLLLAWAAAGVVTLGAFLAVSLDDLAEVGTAAARGSAPALWIVPALLLLAMPDLVAQAAALLLIAFSTALVVSQRAPCRHRLSRPVDPPPVMFAAPAMEPGWMTRSLFPVVLGALAMQSGVWFLYRENRLAAALAIALAAAAWARSWTVRGAPRKCRRAWPHAMAFVLAIALAWSSAPTGPDGSETASASFSAGLRGLLTRTRHPSPKPAAQPAGAPAAVPLAAPIPASTLSGIPGVILRTRAKPVRRAISLAPPPGVVIPRLSENGPDTFPFSGEYYLFGASHNGPPQDSKVVEGTPLDAAYLNTSGGTVVTEAYQPLLPPVDFQHCGEVEVDIRSAENFGAAATMQLVSGGPAEELGTEFFGISRSREETLQYVVPTRPRPPVTAIRLRFYSLKSGAVTSTKVAVLRFRLLAHP